MPNSTRSELLTPILIALTATLIGILLGQVLICLLIACLAYIAWLLLNLVRVSIWLTQPQEDKPPNVAGTFARLVDRISRNQRRQQREQKRLRSMVKRQQNMISDLKDAVILIDKKNRIVWLNKESSRLFSLSEKRDEGNALFKAVKLKKLQQYIEKANYAEPLRLKLNGGVRPVWLDVNVTEYNRGDKLLVCRDFSRIHHLEQMRKDFIGNLSHEIRTPLTVLAGYLETLQLQPDANPTVQRIHKEMDKQAQRMTSLIKDLLTLAQLENDEGKDEFHNIDVARIVEHIVDDAYQLEQYNGHEIKTDITPEWYLRGNESALTSAFGNLLYNAVRHTPAGTKINVVWKVKKGTGYFSVTDNGPGIDAKHLPRLTERFYRVEGSRNSSTGGTGLGLAIVKHSLFGHHAELDINSKAGKGSTFTCIFPSSQLKKNKAHQ